MDYLMLRSYDQAGYYETRLILAIISLAVAVYFIYYKSDRRFLLMFGSGVLLQTLMEFGLQSRELRGVDPTISLFGANVPGMLSPILNGFFEGGAVGVFALWFADLRSAKARLKDWWPFYGLSALVVALAFVAGFASRNRPLTSARPIFATASILVITVLIFVCLMIAWRKDDISSLAGFYAGLLLFAFLNIEPLHLTGAQYIGLPANPQPVAASSPIQIVVMFLSLAFETAGGKLHYFMVPFAFGWIALRERQDRNRERYSTQHLHDLSSRGWRKKSKPFAE
jgi:hypothetical protein